jgi:hypothetical protein
MERQGSFIVVLLHLVIDLPVLGIEMAKGRRRLEGGSGVFSQHAGGTESRDE